MTDELKARIAKLPTWARDYIRCLELRAESMLDEAVKARQERDSAVSKAKKLSEANEALLEILRAAGKGGHDWAKAVVSVLESYEIYQQQPAPDSPVDA